MTGLDLITAERRRQIDKEGWTAEHDAQHDEGQLAWAAMYYAMPHFVRDRCRLCGDSSFIAPDSFFDETGWHPDWAKRDNKDRIQQLAVAGALIAAEIDRLSETIVCAAIRDSNGAVHSKPRPARHHDCFFSGCETDKITCGFVTSSGYFVDRREAYKIAVAAGQLLPTALAHHAPVLMSEDVW